MFDLWWCDFFPFHAQFVPFACPDFRISNLSQFFSFWRLIFFPFAWHDFRISGGARFFFPMALVSSDASFANGKQGGGNRRDAGAEEATTTVETRF